MNSWSDFDYLPFADGPYRMTMGLMALKPADWIEIDSRYAPEIALRKSLLDERRGEVLAALPGSEAACREVLDQLAGGFKFGRKHRRLFQHDRRWRPCPAER